MVSWTDENGDQYDFTYNWENRILHVDKNGSPLADYAYDNMGQRVKKLLYSNGSVSNTIWCVYGTEGLLAEYDDTGKLIKKYVWNPDRPWGTDPLWQADSAGDHYYYINDHLFTPQKMIDEAFNNVWQADWQSFGGMNTTVNDVENNLRFPGQYFDSEIRLYYNSYRYYSYETGRYFGEDPIYNNNNQFAYANRIL